jgi:phenylpyruvate tautomerase PptA (4-oxalocrotonate tautomerase family)
MAQVKIFGLRTQLNPIKARLSDVIHSCLEDALKLPAEKRFHRFFPLDADDFMYPADRTEAYTIIEISMFEGRSVEAKKSLIRLIIARLGTELNLRTQDIEITIFETPRHNWGIRGVPGDELGLDYKVEV